MVLVSKVQSVVPKCCVTHILYPHDVFGFLFSKFPGAFEVHLRAGPQKLERFWKQFLRTEYGKQAADRLPTLRGKSAQDLDHCIPLIIHGDACPVTKKRSAMFAQWGGLLGASCYPK